MRFIHFTLIFLFAITTTKAQEKNDFGLIVGTSYYMGDYNQGIPFYQPSIALGGVFKHNFTTLFALRLTASYGNIRGSHNPSNFYLPGSTPSFSKQIIEANLAAEFSFLQFSTRKSKKKSFSPYATLGVGAAYVNGSIIPQIPMGIGMKYSPFERISVGLEWHLHKTFNDYLDDYSNISELPKSIIHNNDWFGIAGIVVTFRLINRGAICPAYE